jgi:hypothetical protein
MMPPLEKIESAIEETLRTHQPQLRRLGFGRWSSVFANGAAHALTVRIIDDDWLVMEALLRETSTPADLWEHLNLNGRLGGLCKVVLGVENRSLRLRAEIPLGEEIDLERRLRQACASFEATLSALGGSGHTDEPLPLLTELRDSSCDLGALCAEAGWAWNQRSGVVLVELNERRAFHQATLEAEAGGPVRIHVDLVSCGSWPSESRWALAMLLLSASRAVRLARGFATGTGAMLTAGLEIRFGSAPSALELARSLAALSTACALAGGEAQALEDLSIARAYLGVQGGTDLVQQVHVTSPKE